MLSQSDVDISEVMREFASFGVETAFFVPTQTGLAKSIIDAHQSLRSFLRSNGVHDYDLQAKNQENKIVLSIDLIRIDRFDIRTISLYRPETKNGDPRLWISRLKDVAQPGNLMAIFLSKGNRLTLVNCSDETVWSTRHSLGSPLQQALASAGTTTAAGELLEKLREVCRQGYIKSLRDGPTGVGYTLETLLGIEANSSKSPDYKGIELKSGRTHSTGRKRTRTTLFSKTPDWDAGRLSNGAEIIAAYGYSDASTGRLQLYCSLNNEPNSLGLFLRLQDDASRVEMYGSTEQADLVWPLRNLEETLKAKHSETFWVSARQRRSAKGSEEFLYERVVHTRRPLASNLGTLISDGKVEIDLTLSTKASGATRDHGYLFKIRPEDIELLFPPPVIHDLAA